jgi:uncharacterized protein
MSTQNKMTENKKTIEIYIDGFNKSDHAQILDCLTDDVEWVIPGFFHGKGKKEFDAEIENDQFQGPPTIKIVRLTEEEDVVIAEGEVHSKKSDGSPFHLLFCDVFEMQNGKIKKLTSYLVPLPE